MRILIAMALVAVLAGGACSTKSEPAPAPKGQAGPEAGKPAATTTTDFVLDKVPT